MQDKQIDTSAEGAVAGEAEEGSVGVDGTDHRVVAGGLGGEPRDHAVGGARLVVVKGGGSGDGFVEDGQDRLGVGCVGAGDDVHGARIRSVRGNPILPESLRCPSVRSGSASGIPRKQVGFCGVNRP